MPTAGISRRTFALGALGSSLAGPLSAQSDVPLKDIARKSGLLFGSTIDYPSGHVLYDERFTKLYTQQCGIFVTGYQPLWSQNQPYRGAEFDYSKIDRIVDFAKTHGVLAAGHTLIWHQFVPLWVK